jgi:MbtH protein
MVSNSDSHARSNATETAMRNDETGDDTIYSVVVNHEEQYSIWPAHRATPPGWKGVGKTGSKLECLAYISETWIDMRPLSLRRRMAASPPTDPPTRPTSVSP